VVGKLAFGNIFPGDIPKRAYCLSLQTVGQDTLLMFLSVQENSTFSLM